VYANTLYRPLKPFFADRQWAHITDWEAELSPFYDQASRMLGVVTNPTTTPHTTCGSSSPRTATPGATSASRGS